MVEVLIEEKDFMCPCCGTIISMLLELGHGGQRYIEDCEICCSPITISYQVDDIGLSDFLVKPAHS